MQIKIDNDNYVTGYAVIGGIEGGIDVPGAKIPEDFAEDFYPRKWKYDKGTFSLSGEPRPESDAEPEFAPDLIGAILATTVDHEYRLILREIGVGL